MKQKNIIFIILFLIFLVGCTQEQIKESKKLTIYEEPATISEKITKEGLTKHNTEEDCWVVYEGKVYDLTNAPRHPNMDKTFWRHCGDLTSFEQAAKIRHSTSDSSRVENYADYVGELE